MTTPDNTGYAAANKPLVKALTRHVDALCAGARPHAAAQRARTDAAGWVYATVLIAWAEDHGLIPQSLREDAAARRKQHLADGGTNAAWIRQAYAHLGAHPSTVCLVDPHYTLLGENDPAEAPLSALLDWWADDAPDLDRRGDGGAPDSITGWLPADLLQALHGDRIDGNAFSQTPWFVADFLCERTLVPAALEFAQAPVLRVIDPAAGAGHLLVWIAIGLHHLYTTGTPARAAVGAERSVRRILAGLHGVELDPLTAAVARLRLTVLTGALLGVTPLRLHRIPAWVRPRVAVGNALLAAQGEHVLGAVLDDTADYPGILEHGTYHAVIANPPYKVIGDKAVRDVTRVAYKDVCSGQFNASVPFTRLMFDLAICGGEAQPSGIVAGPEQLSLFDGAGPVAA